MGTLQQTLYRHPRESGDPGFNNTKRIRNELVPRFRGDAELI